MTRLQLSLACTQTDRAAPILDGRVRIAGCDVIGLPGQTQEIFRRVLQEQAFDIAEMSMGSQIVQAGRGADNYVALPIYLSRAFRHSAIYIRTDRGITRPEDLAGRTVGVNQYQQTVGLWVRGILGDEYGVHTRDVNWVTGGIEAPGGSERIALALPEGINVTPIGQDETLNGLLADGRIDAAITTNPPSCFSRGAPGVGRLFPDYRTAEVAYFRKTRIFPVMHCVVIRRSLVDQHPWLPGEVFKAFVKAKAIAMADLVPLNIARVTLPWVADEAAQTRAIMGDRMWSYGFAESRHEIEAMLRYALADGLIEDPMKAEELFHPDTLTLPDKA